MIEKLLEEGQTFDAVCALEIVEHVADPVQFIQTVSKLVRPGGFLFLSTINRTPLAYFGTIFMAERVLGWVPKGTHSLEKFITPEELKRYVEQPQTSSGQGEHSLKVVDISGMVYNPLSRKWSIEKAAGTPAMNYILTAVKV